MVTPSCKTLYLNKFYYEQEIKHDGWTPETMAMSVVYLLPHCKHFNNVLLNKYLLPSDQSKLRFCFGIKINKSIPVVEDMASRPCSSVLFPAWPSGICVENEIRTADWDRGHPAAAESTDCCSSHTFVSASSP